MTNRGTYMMNIDTAIKATKMKCACDVKGCKRHPYIGVVVHRLPYINRACTICHRTFGAGVAFWWSECGIGTATHVSCAHAY